MHRRLMEEAFSQGNMDVVDELIAPDYVHHFPDDPKEEEYVVLRA